MKVFDAKLKDVKIIEPDVFEDERGFFMESYSEEKYKKLGIDFNFVQDNHSLSAEVGVVRGLHFQRGDDAQTKLIRVVTGEVLDVVVDLRKGSPTYGQWESFILSEHNRRQLLVPRGFAHGFSTLTPCISVIIIIMQKQMQALHSMITSLELTGRLIYQKRLFQRKIKTFLYSKNLKRTMILSMGKGNYNII